MEPKEPGQLSRNQAYVPHSSSDTHVFRYEAKSQPVTKPDVKITAAYGLREAPKVVELLDHKDPAVRRQALHVLNDMFHTPKSIVQCLKVGVVEKLAHLALDVDDIIRCRATAALILVAEDANGRKMMLSSAAADTLFPALSDLSEDVRMNTYKALLKMSSTLEGVNAICRASYTELLVKKSHDEVDHIKPWTLQLLYNALRQSNGHSLKEAQNSGAINVCTALLQNSNSEVREKSALALTILSLNEAGKQFAIKANAVPPLCKLLSDSTWQVRANCAGALMNIAVDDEGKVATIQSGGVEALIKMLADKERLVKLNALKAIASVCPHPAARKKFVESKDCLLCLNELAAQNDDELLCKSAQIAKDVVEWKP